MIGRRLEPVRYLPVVVAGLSAATGGIHGTVFPGHAGEYWLFGVFFALVGAFQLAWAYRVLTRPSAFLATLGIAVNGVVIALWVLTRTVGLPLGPAPRQHRGRRLRGRGGHRL